jgi:hypothetical protein
VVFDQEAGSNFAIENKGIVIITHNQSIIFVFHQTNFFFSRQIHSQLSSRLSRRLPALAKIDCAIDPLTATPPACRNSSRNRVSRPAYVIIETRDRDREVPDRRGGAVACQMYGCPNRRS